MGGQPLLLGRKLALQCLHLADLFVERGYPHDEWALLRSEAPVFYYERPGVRPFWAVTRHADIITVSRQPELFRSGQYLFVTVEQAGHMLHLDRPDAVGAAIEPFLAVAG